ncbi:MAG TPA: HAD hydrolase-like protein [Labilithrix sp.]|nr:HAD hydrolase-like protein [Labilithrix sp.]
MKPFPRCHALLFDLDGTLVDSQRDIAEALNFALVTATGHEALSFESIRPMIGDGARTLVERALKAILPVAVTKEDVDRVLSLFLDRYAAHPCAHTALLPGTRDVLALGLGCAVVTNKPRAIASLVLEHLGIARSFGAIYAGGDGPLKPAPDGLVWAAEQLGVPVEQAWMVGDGPQDIVAGRAAGCFTVAVFGIADRERVLAAKPDLVAESLVDVAAHVRASIAGPGDLTSV